ncbi:MAG TPA: methionine synthase [Nocardioidaceae bacterium]|nr:methionine synthase [Nocardioidaceae bacterium]
MTILASGVGSFPGEDAAAFDEALRVVLGELSDLPHLPELPGRGAHAAMTGRALSLVAELGADVQPAGWRLTGGAPGLDQRRGRSLLAQDLDALEEQTQGYDGRLKLQVAGPWTLAATVERPKGDRLLADRGARRELAQALAEGIGTHVADVRRRVPGASLVVQVDEPALPAVLAGSVPTASGFHRHRSVDAPEASPALEWVMAAIADSGATPVVHCCASNVPFGLLVGAGARGVSVDLSALGPESYDPMAELVESGRMLMLGVVPSTDPATWPDDAGVTERVLRLLDMLGLDPAGTQGSGDLVITPSCGLAGASTAWARRAYELSARVARNVASG